MVRVEVFWGNEPEHQSEREFLARLRVDLANQRLDALILANFYLSGGLQVDCLVIIPDHLCHIELKHYVRPIIGGKNGAWKVKQADGTLQDIEGQNPYAQTMNQRFALSDDLRTFAKESVGTPQAPRKEFYRWFDTVVCIFPILPEGSSVPSDYKVKTLGYKDTLALLTNTTRRFFWDRSCWLRFVQYLGLTTADAGPKAALTDTAAHSAIESYRQAFTNFYRRDLHELVPMPLVAGEHALISPELLSLLQEGASVQLIGVSGSGKSHLATHTALSRLGSWVPIFVRARMYEGRLPSLLNRSVAPLTGLTAQQVFDAAGHQGQSPLLVVLDGINECPAALYDQLISDLVALSLRAQFALLLTSQAPVSLPPSMNTKVVRMGTLGKSDRQAILASYHAQEINEISESFQTAYELSLAAECAAELKSRVTRAQLFDSFVRRSIADLSSPAATRVALRQVAFTMDEQLTAALPVDEVWRCVERVLAPQVASHAPMDDLFRCKLVRMQQGSFAFSHELIGRFLIGEALLLSSEPPQLVRELGRPRHADLSELVLPLETQVGRLRSVLTGLADAELYVKSFDGDLGKLAGTVARREARTALAAAVTLMDETSLTLLHPESFPEAELDRQGLIQSENAVLAAVAKLLPAGHFLDEALDVFDATDRALHRAAQTARHDKNETLSPSVLAATIISGRSGPQPLLPAAILNNGCEQARYDRHFRRRTFEPISKETLEPLIYHVAPESYSRLYFLCLLVEAADQVSVMHFVPTMLRKCWDSRAYHLRLQGLQTTQFFCREATGVVREEIATLLNSFDVQNDIMFSSALVEVLSSYGLIEPPGTAEGVLNEIRTLLGAAPSEDVYRAAYGIYGSQFEDVVAEPYCEAVGALSEDERIQFLTLAAQGGDRGFFADTILHELLQAHDPRALPAFEHWTKYPDNRSPGPHEDTACYSLAIQGSANLQALPPQQSTPASDDEAAWQCYGQLIFWLRRPGFDHTQAVDHCAPIWTRLLGSLSLAAVDPLYRLLHAWSLLTHENSRGEDTHSHGLIVRTFPDEIRRLLEHALGRVDKLTSLYRHLDRNEHAQYILDTLGVVGTEHTINLLEDYVEDPRLGASALGSIKKLRALR